MTVESYIFNLPLATFYLVQLVIVRNRFCDFSSLRRWQVPRHVVKFYPMLIWRAFWRVKFGLLVKMFATFFISFSVWCFKMEFIPFPDLLNIGFTIVEIGMFYGGEHLAAKICRFLTCFDKITSRWRFSLVGT